MSKRVLALGADMKNRILFANRGSLYFGPDIGDLSKAQNFEFFKKEVDRIVKKITPDIIVYDLHPHYFSSRFIKRYNLQAAACRLQPVQHHHAHIASVMQEHELKRPVIGVSFDGTGYGLDGNSWGGEFLLVEGSEIKRVAYLKYRVMPGGDKVVYEPWRMALSILGRKAFPFLTKVRKEDKELILKMMSKNINSPLTSSAGRLFDAAGALLGVCVYASYEAQGPIKLEAMCDEKITQRYKFMISTEEECFVIDTDELFLGMLKDLKQGRDARFIAAKFHNSMVEIVVSVVKKLARSLVIKDIALSGGVFQNNFLRTKVIEKMRDLSFNIFTNSKTPVNDFNISLGQYYVARYL